MNGIILKSLHHLQKDLGFWKPFYMILHMKPYALETQVTFLTNVNLISAIGVCNSQMNNFEIFLAETENGCALVEQGSICRNNTEMHRTRELLPNEPIGFLCNRKIVIV